MTPVNIHKTALKYGNDSCWLFSIVLEHAQSASPCDDCLAVFSLFMICRTLVGRSSMAGPIMNASARFCQLMVCYPFFPDWPWGLRACKGSLVIHRDFLLRGCSMLLPPFHASSLLDLPILACYCGLLCGGPKVWHCWWLPPCRAPQSGYLGYLR